MRCCGDLGRSIYLLAACSLFAACAPEPDLTAATPDELIQLAAAATNVESRDSLGNRASVELFGRSKPIVVAGLRAALGNESARVRSWAARTSGELIAGFSGQPLEPGTRVDLQAALVALLDDREEEVRASALLGLARSCVRGRPEPVPEELESATLALLRSELTASRFVAAYAAAWLFPSLEADEPLVLQLVAQARSEPDPGVRFSVAMALERVAPAAPAVGECLLDLLDDAEEDVRCSAASGLGSLVVVPKTAVERVLRCATDAAEAGDVRKAAGVSLARLATSAESADTALLALLAIETLFRSYEVPQWLDAVGRVTARVPNSEAGMQARDLLETAAQGEDRDAARTATAALARIALATDDVDLGLRALAGLRGVLPEMHAAAASDPVYSWIGVAGWAVPVMEAMVPLVSWPAMTLDASELRPTLELLKKEGLPKRQEWAREQLGRLK